MHGEVPGISRGPFQGLPVPAKSFQAAVPTHVDQVEARVQRIFDLGGSTGEVALDLNNTPRRGAGWGDFEPDRVWRGARSLFGRYGGGEGGVCRARGDPRIPL